MACRVGVPRFQGGNEHLYGGTDGLFQALQCFLQLFIGYFSLRYIVGNASESFRVTRRISQKGYKSFNILSRAVFSTDLPLQIPVGFSGHINLMEGAIHFFPFFRVRVDFITHARQFVSGVSKDPAHSIIKERKVSEEVGFKIAFLDVLQNRPVLLFTLTQFIFRYFAIRDISRLT